MEPGLEVIELKAWCSWVSRKSAGLIAEVTLRYKHLFYPLQLINQDEMAELIYKSKDLAVGIPTMYSPDEDMLVFYPIPTVRCLVGVRSVPDA